MALTAVGFPNSQQSTEATYNRSTDGFVADQTISLDAESTYLILASARLSVDRQSYVAARLSVSGSVLPLTEVVTYSNDVTRTHRRQWSAAAIVTTSKGSPSCDLEVGLEGTTGSTNLYVMTRSLQAIKLDDIGPANWRHVQDVVADPIRPDLYEPPKLSFIAAPGARWLTFTQWQLQPRGDAADFGIAGVSARDDNGSRIRSTTTGQIQATAGRADRAGGVFSALVTGRADGSPVEVAPFVQVDPPRGWVRGCEVIAINLEAFEHATASEDDLFDGSDVFEEVFNDSVPGTALTPFGFASAIRWGSQGEYATDIAAPDETFPRLGYWRGNQNVSIQPPQVDIDPSMIGDDQTAIDEFFTPWAFAHTSLPADLKTSVRGVPVTEPSRFRYLGQVVIVMAHDLRPAVRSYTTLRRRW